MSNTPVAAVFVIPRTPEQIIEEATKQKNCLRSYVESVKRGDTVVALVDDSATVKTFYKEDGGYRLQPENSEMEPIIVDEVSILGKVVASLRYY